MAILIKNMLIKTNGLKVRLSPSKNKFALFASMKALKK